MKLAKIVFFIAGVYGVLAIAPLYFLEGVVASPSQPVNHPEFFYGFVGVTLSWQVAFLIIATDPKRFRPLMYAACLEKLSFGVAIPVLFVMGRVTLPMVFASVGDLVLLILFIVSLFATAKESAG